MRNEKFNLPLVLLCSVHSSVVGNPEEVLMDITTWFLNIFSNRISKLVETKRNEIKILKLEHNDGSSNFVAVLICEQKRLDGNDALVKLSKLLLCLYNWNCFVDYEMFYQNFLFSSELWFHTQINSSSFSR